MTYELCKPNSFWVSRQKFPSLHEAEAAARARSVEHGETYSVRETHGPTVAIFSAGIKFVPESER